MTKWTILIMFLVSIGIIAVMVVLGYNRNDIGTVSAFALAAITIAISGSGPRNGGSDNNDSSKREK